MLQNKRVPLFVSADPALGALDTNSPDNNSFSVQYKKAISIPSHAWDISIELVQAQIWWTAVNIHDLEPDKNNLFQLEVDGDAVYNIEIARGLYNVSDLNNAVNNELINQGLASGIVSIVADRATGRILLVLNGPDLQVTWIPNSFFELVGFDSGQQVPSAGFTTAIFSELSPNIANFSSISSFLVHTNLLQSGIPLGDSESQTLASVQITVPPGGLRDGVPREVVDLHLHDLVLIEVSEAKPTRCPREVGVYVEDPQLHELIDVEIIEADRLHLLDEIAVHLEDDHLE